MTVPDIDTSKMSSDDIAKLQGKLDSDLKEAQKREARKKEEDFKTEVEKQHQMIVENSKILVTSVNIDSIREKMKLLIEKCPDSCLDETDLKDLKVGETYTDNQAISEMIDADELTIFQYDYLVDECCEDSMSETAKTKLQRMWSELRFLHEYYDYN